MDRQKDKDMSETVNIMTDEQKKQDFNKKEWRMKRKWKKVLTLIILQINFLGVFFAILGIVNYTIVLSLIMFIEAMILVGLIYSYYRLVKLLKEFHPVRYL